MDKNFLLKSAGRLAIVSKQTATEYHQKAERLIMSINELMLGRPDIKRLTGKDNIEMMKDNHANHVRFIASILKNPNPEVLVETVLWVFKVYRNHGFTENYWAAQLNAWVGILQETLSTESFGEVYPYYEWMQTNIPVFAKLSDKELKSQNSMH